MKTGRPTKYDVKKYEELAEKYISTSGRRYQRLLKSKSSSKYRYKETYIYKMDATLISVKGFAQYCGLNRSTLYDWRMKYPDFSDIIEHIQCVQEVDLIQGGLSGEYNTKMAVLLLGKIFSNQRRNIS